ncbi:MAG: phosphate acyltransferase PlsX [Oscillospiraceae bacterium]|nr:phosphate acyltransferase PlsX [Oscillospiraceae bacterium]
MKIILDAMGGDNAPLEIVKGGLQAVQAYGVQVALVGNTEEVLKALKDLGHSDLPPGLSLNHASQSVKMTDDPAKSSRDKPDSSMTVGFRMLSENKGDAFVSAGNTGALLSGAIFGPGRIKGIRRAALAPVVPTKTGGALLIDCGANLECKPEYLLQFAYMGSIYAGTLFGKEKPVVGLLNIGAEENKGTALQKEAYFLMSQAAKEGGIEFAGNVEARDVVFGACDVVVAEGFSGNIFLKTMEGVGLFFADMLKGMFYKNTLSKLAAITVKEDLRQFKKILDYSEVGGSPLLGICRPVIKAHGSSNAKAVQNAVRQAKEFVDGRIIDAIGANIEAMNTRSNNKNEA